MPSRFQKIRTYLSKQDGPRTAGEIREGIGAKKTRAFLVCLSNMTRDGWITRQKDGARWIYVKTDKRPRRKSTAKQLTARRRARERALYHAKGGRTRAEWLAELQRRAEERRLQRESEAAERRKQREAKAAARAAMKKPLHDRKRKPHVVVRLGPVSLAKREEARETVEQWMARTGKRPQVLPLGAVSRPIGLGDYNGRTRKAA